MKANNKIIKFKTKEEFEFKDLTKEIIEFVKESGITQGLINIQNLHTSAAVLMNENEPLLIEDFKDNLRKTAARDNTYRHDDLTKRTVNLCENECINGHSHCMAIHLPSSITLNVINAELQLGQWQRIFFIELDRNRERNVQLQIIGE